MDNFRDVFLKSGLIKLKSYVVFNPTFGIASIAVNGADADIFADGVLYDIKTTKKHGFNWQYSAQLIGYYMLNEIAKESLYFEDLTQLINCEISKIAFYKPRFEEIEYVDIADQDTDKLKNAISELGELVL